MRNGLWSNLLYLNHDIAFPSPALAKAGDGAVHGASNLWHDHACKIAGTASLHRLEQLIAAIRDRAPEGREHERFITSGDRRRQGGLHRDLSLTGRRSASRRSDAGRTHPGRQPCTGLRVSVLDRGQIFEIARKAPRQGQTSIISIEFASRKYIFDENEQLRLRPQSNKP